MKIAINGCVIDTDNIYAVTEIVNNYDITDYPDSATTFAGGFSFEIKLCLDKSLIVKKHIFKKDNEDKFKVEGLPDLYISDDINSIVISHLEKVRNKIIALWSNNQSTIPQINY